MDKTWGFYGRNSELAEIERITSSGRWFFCAISGRRRIGKTTLIHRALRNRPVRNHFYFQVPDSDERGVVQSFQEAWEDYAVAIGMPDSDAIATSHNFRTFSDLASYIALMCENGWIITIDEFQYFHRKALSPFTSFLQAEVDRLRDTNSGGIFVLGSIHTEMTAILEDQSSPLFNRVTDRIHLEHWDFETLFEMLEAHDISSPQHWLFLWSLFEGVPKFYRDCFDKKVLMQTSDHRQSTLQHLFFEGSSPLRDEAMNWFLRELRGRYDSVLKILANIGPCGLAELKAEYSRAGETGETQLGGYLTTLIDRYQMVEKLQPVFAAGNSRKARYSITDNFLMAWLRAIERNVRLSRVRPIDTPLSRADKMLFEHEGYTLEKMVKLLTEEASRKGVGDFLLTDLVLGYWNKPDGSDIEIDLVALNEEDEIIRFGSCKRSQSGHSNESLGKFNKHIERFFHSKEGMRLSGWRIETALYATEFSPENRVRLETAGYICHDLRDFKNRLYST